jgi:hypothetical protein
MIAKVVKRAELGPLRALPTVRHARNERGIRLSPVQYAQLRMDCLQQEPDEGLEVATLHPLAVPRPPGLLRRATRSDGRGC